MKLAQAGIDALAAYFSATGLPMTLTELKIGAEHFEEMARHANPGGFLKNAFVALTDEDIVNIYNESL